VALLLLGAGAGLVRVSAAGARPAVIRSDSRARLPRWAYISLTEILRLEVPGSDHASRGLGKA